MTPVWAVISGKGGVGKSVIAASLAVGLASRAYKVVLIDMDTGLRNLDLMLGLENRVLFDLVDIMDGHATLAQALVVDKQRPNLALLSTSQIHTPQTITEEFFCRLMDQLRGKFDYIVMDCPSGVDYTFGLAMRVMTDAVIVTHSDDIAMRDADRVVGLLRHRTDIDLHLVVNRVRPDWVSERLQYTPEAVAQTLDVPLVGVLYEDDEVARCVIARRPIIESDGKTWEQMDAALRRMMGEAAPIDAQGKGHPQGFLRRLLNGK